MTTTRRWDLWLFVVGLGLGAADASALIFFGADLTVGGRDITVPLFSCLVLTFGVMGYLTGRVVLDHEDVSGGTVGAVARDASDGLAAATSTGGMTNQLVGRVGDTPLIGAGTTAAP